MIDKLLSIIPDFNKFLNLSYDKILIGILIIGMGLLTYELMYENNRNKDLIDKYEKEIQLLNKEKVQITINYEKEKYILMKDYYKKTDSINNSVDEKMKKLIKQQKVINNYVKD